MSLPPSERDGYLYVNKNGNIGYKLTLPAEDEKFA